MLRTQRLAAILVVLASASLIGVSRGTACDRGGGSYGQFKGRMAYNKSGGTAAFNKATMGGGFAKQNIRGNFAKPSMGGGFGKQSMSGTIGLGKPAGAFGGAGKQVGRGFNKTFGEEVSAF